MSAFAGMLAHGSGGLGLDSRYTGERSRLCHSGPVLIAVIGQGRAFDSEEEAALYWSDITRKTFT